MGRRLMGVFISWPMVVVLLLAVVEAGWMAFDGIRALIVGDFITPKTGTYAGQLGPWRHLFEAAGINPRGTGVKLLFAAYGLAWLGLVIATLRGLEWGTLGLLLAAIGALWYLPVGTAFSVIQIILLLVIRSRQ